MSAPGTFTLTIDLGNDAMRTAADVADALEAVAARVRADGLQAHAQSIRDANGNRVGSWEHRPWDGEPYLPIGLDD